MSQLITAARMSLMAWSGHCTDTCIGVPASGSLSVCLHLSACRSVVDAYAQSKHACVHAHTHTHTPHTHAQATPTDNFRLQTKHNPPRQPRLPDDHSCLGRLLESHQSGSQLSLGLVSVCRPKSPCRRLKRGRQIQSPAGVFVSYKYADGCL